MTKPLRNEQAAETEDDEDRALYFASEGRYVGGPFYPIDIIQELPALGERQFYDLGGESRAVEITDVQPRRITVKGVLHAEGCTDDDCQGGCFVPCECGRPGCPYGPDHF